MTYTYRKRALPGSPRVEWMLLRDGKPVVFFQQRAEEARRVAG